MSDTRNPAGLTRFKPGDRVAPKPGLGVTFDTPQPQRATVTDVDDPPFVTLRIDGQGILARFYAHEVELAPEGNPAGWTVESAGGQSMSEGIQAEREARRVAQDHADRLRETVYLWGPGMREPEEIHMSKHTPTPWYLGNVRSDVSKAAEINASKGHELIAALGIGLGNHMSDAKVNANAEFIVRSVNAHHPLVSALERAREEIRALCALRSDESLRNGHKTGADDEIEKTFAEIRAALQLAEGK